MHPNAQVITRFYTAFQNRDLAVMASCYHADVVFSDPVFPALRGPTVAVMWRMLSERAPDLRITFDDVVADDTTGRAHWEATYTFSATGRAVHNVIEASFAFHEGTIILHRDDFSFSRWASQALGPTARMLGWTGSVKKRVRARAAKGLASYRDGGSGHP